MSDKFNFQRTVTVLDMKINTNSGGLPVVDVVWGVSVDGGRFSRFIKVNTKSPFGMSPDVARQAAAEILKAAEAVEAYTLPADVLVKEIA